MTKTKINIPAIVAIVLALVFATVGVKAQKSGEYYLSGIVRDSVNLEPLPFASVTVYGEAIGTLTNEKGIFELTVPNDARELVVTCLGYDRKSVNISKKQVNLYDVKLSPSYTELQEVVVRRKKYSKKNNPAVEFVKRIKSIGEDTDPKRNQYYNYDKHEIMSLGLNDFAGKDENSWAFKKFPFLWDHVDTSEISGKPILKVLVKEKISENHYRKQPKSTKEIVTGQRQEGVDEIVNQNSMQDFFDDVLREIDLYEDDINLLSNRFVSPLSKIGPDFYKYYLTDTVEVSGEKCIVLSFYPHNQTYFGFNGQIYVPVNDSTMFIKKVIMRTPRNINLNFIDNLFISQEYERAPDGSRLKKHDDLTIEAKVVSGTPGVYVRRNIAYNNHNFDIPQDLSIFAQLGARILETGANNRDETFWDQNRQLQVTENEKRINNLMERLRSVPVYYWTEKALKIMFTGYVSTAKVSKFDYGPVNTTISSSHVEGIRLRAGGMTTANLSKRFFAKGYVAYGIKDHKWKYGMNLEYSFHDKEYHSREFPVHSLRLTSKYDVDQLGQHYLFTNPDNVFLSLKRMKDMLVTYQALNKLEYTLELRNNFSLIASVENCRQNSSPYVHFIDGYGTDHKHYDESSLYVQLRYAPGEKFYQTRSDRIPINLDAPVFMISHTIAPKGWLGSTFMVNKTEASFQKRFWLSVFGFTDVLIKGGHVWSKSPFPNLLIPNANLSYTIQPESYAMMNPMEFINDSYASADLTYWLNGYLFNLIPGFRQLRLREVVGFKALWGQLSDKNDPDKNPDLFRFPTSANVTKMTQRPYMEISAGIDNIFKCLRVDYVWRMSYLDVPYPIDRHGLRVMMHVTF